MTKLVEAQFREDLVCILDVLQIPWSEGPPLNGAGRILLVRIDAEIDDRLESIIGNLADLRWRYGPGRRLQLAFDLEIPEMHDAPH